METVDLAAADWLVVASDPRTDSPSELCNALLAELADCDAKVVSAWLDSA